MSPALVVDDADPAELPRLLAARGARLVVVTGPVPPGRLRQLRAAARAVGARVGVAPGRAGADGTGVLLLAQGGGGEGTAARGVARAFDLAALALLAPAALLVGLVAAAAVRAGSPGPVFFVQERVGRGGRRFRMWKFRTMRADAPPYALSPGDADPRVTRVGRLLRPAGLDELPQLVNVLRGEMRLVGPRPEMPFVVDRYTALERERLAATPGVTGLWQLCGDRARPIHEQLAYDFAYMASASPALDLRILAGTALHAARTLLGALPRAGVAPRPRAVPHE